MVRGTAHTLKWNCITYTIMYNSDNLALKSKFIPSKNILDSKNIYETVAYKRVVKWVYHNVSSPLNASSPLLPLQLYYNILINKYKYSDQEQDRYSHHTISDCY